MTEQLHFLFTLLSFCLFQVEHNTTNVLTLGFFVTCDYFLLIADVPFHFGNSVSHKANPLVFNLSSFLQLVNLVLYLKTHNWTPNHIFSHNFSLEFLVLNLPLGLYLSWSQFLCKMVMLRFSLSFMYIQSSNLSSILY